MTLFGAYLSIYCPERQIVTESCKQDKLKEILTIENKFGNINSIQGSQHLVTWSVYLAPLITVVLSRQFGNDNWLHNNCYCECSHYYLSSLYQVSASDCNLVRAEKWLYTLDSRSGLCSRTLARTGQDTGVTLWVWVRVTLEDISQESPPRPASGEITISNSSWKIIRHPQEEDFHAC